MFIGHQGGGLLLSKKADHPGRLEVGKLQMVWTEGTSSYGELSSLVSQESTLTEGCAP